MNFLTEIEFLKRRGIMCVAIVNGKFQDFPLNKRFTVSENGIAYFSPS